jgi:hypothetical protein
MSESDVTPSRRAFLGTVAGASTVVAMAALSDKTAAKPQQPATTHPDWDLSWADRVAKASHRVVFDSPEIDSGMALMNALL